MAWSSEGNFISPGSGTGTGSGAPEDPEDPCERCSRFSTLRQAVARRFRDNHYRRLSIFSIICGLSCIGVIALKYSVKAKERQRWDPDQAAVLGQKAKKFSLISIATLCAIVVAVPVLMALVSYLATLKD